MYAREHWRQPTKRYKRDSSVNHYLSWEGYNFRDSNRIMADLKYRLAKKLDEEALEMASDPYGEEFAAAPEVTSMPLRN